MPTVNSVLKLNTGFTIPRLGLGTWKSDKGLVRSAVEHALNVGYRHIDCAHVYQNENEVGEALEAKVADGTISRGDLFVTSKLWCTAHEKAAVVPSLRKTLEHLRLDYLDLYLIHWPVAYEAQQDGELFPKSEDGLPLTSDVDYLETWQGMEECVRLGLVRTIGVSNFNTEQCERVLQHATIPIGVNQIECHPYLNQRALIDYCASRDIVVTAYSPLGSPDRPWSKSSDVELLAEPTLTRIAAGYGRSTAQLLIRYQLQRGVCVIPKSVTPSRIEQNFGAQDFDISAEDMRAIDDLDRGLRYCPFEGVRNHMYFPF